MGKTVSRTRLLIVDDNQDICDFLRLVGEGFEFDVVEATSATEAIEIVANFKPNLIFLDLCMPDMDGVEVIAKLAEQRCDASISLVSGMDQRTLSSVQSLGAEQKLTMLPTLTKPMTIEDVEAIIQQYLKHSRSLIRTSLNTHSTKQSVTGGYGLQIDYEPEIHPQDVLHREAICLRARPLLRMDTGRSLEEQELYSTLRANQFAESFFKSQCMEIFHTMQQWQKVNFNPSVTLGVPSFLLENSTLPKLLETFLSEYEVNTGVVAFELYGADSALMSSKMQEVLSRLRLKGIRIRSLISDGGDAALSEADKLPIDECMVDLGRIQRQQNDKADIETEFLYSSLNSVANRKGIRVCAVSINTSSLYELAQQCRFNALCGTQVYGSLSATDVLSAHQSGRFEQGESMLIQPA